MRKINYTWEEFLKDVQYFANYYSKQKDLFRNIYAVPRGGLIFGVLLSHSLGVPLITDKNKITKHTLVVDDISDKGTTLKNLLKNKKFYSVVTLWLGEDSKVQTHYKHLKLKDEWVIYPWETNKSSKYDRTNA